MLPMLENGLDVSKLITHRNSATGFKIRFAKILNDSSDKVVLDWTDL